MKNKFKNKNVFFISNFINFTSFSITNYNFFRILKNKEDKKRFLEKFSISSKNRKKGNLVWFHGASVGELLSVIPL